MSETGPKRNQHWPCQCGGSYALAMVGGLPVIEHSYPACARYHAVETNIDAVRFSEENRASLALTSTRHVN